jgi:hypothetical protein
VQQHKRAVTGCGFTYLQHLVVHVCAATHRYSPAVIDARCHALQNNTNWRLKAKYVGGHHSTTHGCKDLRMYTAMQAAAAA